MLQEKSTSNEKIEALPRAFKKEGQLLKLALVRATNLANKQATIRKFAGSGAAAAIIGGFFAKKGRKLAE